MAKVRFVVKGSQEIVQLIIRVSISRQNDFQKGSKIFIPKKYWNFEEKRLYDKKDKSSFKNDADFITTINNSNRLLSSIENFVFNNLSNPEFITSSSIEDEILKFHGLPTSHETLIKEKEIERKKEVENNNKLLLYIQNYNNIRANDYSIENSTKQKYKYLESVISNYQNYINREINIIECNKEFFLNLETFLFDYKMLMKSTIRRILKNLKTIIYDARNNGLDVNPSINFPIQRIKEGDVVYLNFKELDQIRDFTTDDKILTLTRDWLLIGCYTGQRISDFMRFTTDCIRKYLDNNGNEYSIIEITQVKTKKRVAIPIHPIVNEIIIKYNGFPPLFSPKTSSNATIFNQHLKILLEQIGINRLVFAKEFDENDKRNYMKMIPLYKAASSHICRRSFASNYYAHPNFPTPLLMSITGHQYENTFLQYIGKNDISNALQVAKIFND
ncbi:tyrosine-type recombinase/integrase [Empedobacter falsenii]|uniref:tyrosine-type recombinase/integrase n=1 Tax=Empedobacter falsenii TaxID=343874 RepID=UPI001C56BEFE|nr:tyrosine-type recombinase/integrase [Empedobacter falsenii]MBW1617813.1 tyrosine-type recombinase/integrase [Empedobacter falsenii]